MGDSLACPAFAQLLHGALRTLIDQLGATSFNVGILNISAQTGGGSGGQPIIARHAILLRSTKSVATQSAVAVIQPGVSLFALDSCRLAIQEEKNSFWCRFLQVHVQGLVNSDSARSTPCVQACFPRAAQQQSVGFWGAGGVWRSKHWTHRPICSHISSGQADAGNRRLCRARMTAMHVLVACFYKELPIICWLVFKSPLPGQRTNHN
jgi:hypothetical protein